MIIDTNSLKHAKVGKMYIAGKAAENTDLLKKNEIILLFAGLSTAIDYINENFSEPRNGKSSSEKGQRGGFFHFTTYEEAMDMFRNTPHKLIKFDPLEIRPTDFLEQGSTLDHDVVGDFIDMGRFVEGEPESMGQLHDGLARNRRVKLVVCMTHVNYTQQVDINYRAERIIRLVDALENAHVRTEINAVDSNQCGHIEILVKRFDEAMSIEDIAVISHSDFFRRLMFRCVEYSDTWHWGYGNSYILRSNVDVIKSQLNDEISIYIDGSMHNKANIKKQFDALEKVLEKELSGVQPELNLITVADRGVSVSRLDDVK